MKMKKAVTFAAIALCGVSAPALAQAYVGVVGGYDSVELEYDGVADDKSDVTYGVVAGYDAFLGGAVVGIEAELTDSEVSDTAQNIYDSGIDATLSAGRDIYVGGRLGLKASENVLIYGKAGYTNARVSLTLSDGETSEKYSDEIDGYRLGAGVEYKMNNIGIRAEYRYSDYGEYKYEGEATGIEARRSQVVAAVTFGF